MLTKLNHILPILCVCIGIAITVYSTATDSRELNPGITDQYESDPRLELTYPKLKPFVVLGGTQLDYWGYLDSPPPLVDTSYLQDLCGPIYIGSSSTILHSFRHFCCIVFTFMVLFTLVYTRIWYTKIQVKKTSWKQNYIES